MLLLKPNCECCDKDLPPDAPDAMICTFECTFCRDCRDNRLPARLCPNCEKGRLSIMTLLATRVEWNFQDLKSESAVS